MIPSPRSLVSVSNPRQIWLITGAHAINEFYSVALPPLLPLLVADFSVSYARAGALVTVFYVVYSIFQLPAGLLADRIGQRGLLAGGMVVLAAGIGLASVAPDYRTLVVAQALAGLGGSTYHPTGMSLVSDFETGGTEGRAMGIHGLGGIVGTALAPALIGGVAALYGWRIALQVGALVGVLYAGVFAVLYAPPASYSENRSESRIESEEGGETEGINADSERLDTDGGVDSRSRDGLLARLSRLFNVPLAWWVVVLFLADFLVSFEIGAVRTYATSYLFQRVGESTATANGVFFAMLVGGGIASLGAGHLADRLDRVSLSVGVLALSAGGLIATALVPASVVVLYGWFLLLGVVVYAIFPALNALTTEYSEKEFSGSLFGLMLTAASLGGAAGPLTFGWLAEAVGIRTAFPAIAAVALLAIPAFLLLRRL
jgi:MFS family permease